MKKFIFVILFTIFCSVSNTSFASKNDIVKADIIYTVELNDLAKSRIPAFIPQNNKNYVCYVGTGCVRNEIPLLEKAKTETGNVIDTVKRAWKNRKTNQ